MKKLPLPHALLTAVSMLMVALTVAGPTMSGAAVLCLAADGHADIEAALDACCVLLSRDQRQDEPSGADSGSGSCGTCVDKELAGAPLGANKSWDSASDVGVDGHIRFPESSCDWEIGHTRTADYADHRSRSHNPLSTVILLI